MDLKRLRHLVALADARNFGRAAVQCHLSQPAFSRSIQAAEEELGLVLFDRGTTDITVTDAGAFIVERARKVVFDGHCLERDARLFRERQIGDISLGSGTYPAESMLPGLLTELRGRFPGVKIRTEINHANYLHDRLRAEELDFFLADIRPFKSSPELALRSVEKLKSAFYIRHGHPLLALRAVTAEALRPYGLASPRVPPSVVKFLMGRSPAASDPRQYQAVECDDLGILKRIAMTTDTIAALPDMGPSIPADRGKLIRLPVADLPPIFVDIGIVSLKGRTFSPIAQFAVEFLVAQAKKRTGEG